MCQVCTYVKLNIHSMSGMYMYIRICVYTSEFVNHSFLDAGYIGITTYTQYYTINAL